MKKIVFIGGPTASGKTNIAIDIAKKFNGELINADSRQIYRFLDIGTNKGDIQVRDDGNYISNIKIHLVSFLDPNERYSVYDFKQTAIAKIEDILSRGKLPIIVGGTGLYIDSILKNYPLSNTNDLELRKKLEQNTLEQLQELIVEKHPNEFNTLNQSDKANKRRLVRLIEKLSVSNEEIITDRKYESIFIYPNYNWDELATKIENRVEQMFLEGIVSEVENVLNLGFAKDSVALQGTGYREVMSLIDGNISLQECIKLVKISHRQYAKRQRTWFEGLGRGYNLIRVENAQEAEIKVKEFYESNTRV